MNAIRVLFVAVAATVLTVSPGRAQSDTLRLYSRHDTVPLDPNGFLFNPRWLNGANEPNIDKLCRFRVLTGHLDERRLVTIPRKDPCLSADERNVVTLNETLATVGFGFVCLSNSQTGDVRGHINWFPVTVTGHLRWHGFEGSTGEDYDLGFDLSSPAPNAVTSGNEKLDGQRSYHLELYNQETLARLPTVRGVRVGELTWWHLLKGSLKQKKQMKDLVDERFAIVTGVFGIDGVHNFQAELHPVLAMSVLLGVSQVGGRVREEWAVMVRNRGNEGECAVGSIPVGSSPDSYQTFFIDLGVWPGAGTPQVGLGPYWTSDTTTPLPRVQAESRRLIVAFTYPRPEPSKNGFLFLGTLFVDWPPGASGNPLDCLRGWQPQGASTPKVAGVRADSLVTVGQRAIRPLPGLSGSQAFADTSTRDAVTAPTKGRSTAQALEPLDSSWQVRPRTEAIVVQLVSRPVTDYCDQPDHNYNPACTRRFRLIVGLTRTPATNRASDAFVSGYWFPRGFEPVKHVPLVGGPLFSLGYRLDVRRDRFGKKCVTTCATRYVDGHSVRLSAEFAPNYMALWKVGRLTPYFIFGGGAYIPKSHPVNGTWNVGVGAEFNIHVHRAVPLVRTFFMEFQNYLSGGGVQSHWGFNAGGVISVRPLVGPH
jgi:hypothetical protein